ncbi:MAG TPA: response regulator [Burkholderiales bacterium]|jgi:FixJ family two-component response regulator|nr:response regulator [Burkholderiales bacterium]
MSTAEDRSPSPTAYVVDDDESIRTLWRWLMESNGIPVRTFATAMEFIDSYNLGDPGCIVLDLRLPGMSGLELQDYLRRRNIEIPVVFVTGHGDVPAAVSALKGGAVDFIEKPFGYKHALAIIQKAFDQDAQIRRSRAHGERISTLYASLTEREREVARRIAEGKVNRIIAQELGITMKTVEFHRARLMEKMKVTSVAELVQQLMQLDEPTTLPPLS